MGFEGITSTAREDVYHFSRPSLEQRIWDLETPALFTSGVDGGNIRGGAHAYSCLLTSPPPHVVRGDPAAAAADVTSIAPVAETTA